MSAIHKHRRPIWIWKIRKKKIRSRKQKLRFEIIVESVLWSLVVHWMDGRILTRIHHLKQPLNYYEHFIFLKTASRNCCRSRSSFQFRLDRTQTFAMRTGPKWLYIKHTHAVSSVVRFCIRDIDTNANAWQKRDARVVGSKTTSSATADSWFVREKEIVLCVLQRMINSLDFLVWFFASQQKVNENAIDLHTRDRWKRMPLQVIPTNYCNAMIAQVSTYCNFQWTSERASDCVCL